MDCSTFQNHGKALFSLKNRRTTIYGRPIYHFLPYASLVPIIHGGPYGNPYFLKIHKNLGIWYYGRRFFCKKWKNGLSLW
jgi:hypothetical protein